ncbi:YccF domain-containing protein [Halosimplex pelagicum]|uniref:YccF domain-containing protein n=1 Tax=Halosimplex pelagicum TaxID=869886 RepID=A0A7D5T7U6_9EURY|nr:YccF domain-containing protein [Halosimplex pelagicum]QLH84991.1 YccF domain-containing protein [Halosimplex pelagicum]
MCPDCGTRFESAADAQAADGGTTVVETATEQNSLLVRAVWFFCVGWWASGIWLTIAWVCNLTIIGLPLGLKMINKVPMVISLKKRTDTQVVTTTAEGTSVERTGPDQYSIPVRAVYFVLVGWWASALWMAAAWVVSLTIVGLPVAVMMYNKLPFVTSLYKLR